MISIVTASYNYAQYIGETIQSVLNQTYSDWELVIVDDCSSDNSVEVIKSFKDDRIKLFVNEKNLGLKGTVKRGIELAQGDWVVFLESDDVIESDYLEKKVKIAQKYPDVVLIFNDCEFFGDEKKVCDFNVALKKTRELNSKRKYPANMFWEFYHSNKIFTFSAVMAKRDALLKIDYEPKLDCLLDWHLWIQMAHIGKIYYIDERLTKWRLHDGSYISKSTYKNPFDLQFKTYFDIARQTGNYWIVIKILLMHCLWICRIIKRDLRRFLISYKR